MPDADAIYELLRRAILSGEFLPGNRLIEVELAELYSVSRAKIRSALFLLEHEGLVEHKRNRGATVRVIGSVEAAEILDARAVLEGIAARRAAENARLDDVSELKRILEDMRAQIDAAQLAEASESTMRIHRAILRVAGNATVERLVESLNANLVRYSFRTMQIADRPENSFREHKAVVDAIADGDGAAAEELMRHHLGTVKSTISRPVLANI